MPWYCTKCLQHRDGIDITVLEGTPTRNFTSLHSFEKPLRFRPAKTHRPNPKGERPVLDTLREKIRVIPDFPKEGIAFKDITPLLANPDAFHAVVNSFADRYAGQGVDQVVGIEARGFVLAAALAYKLKAGLTLVRKPGKLPAETLKTSYELEYGVGELEVHRDAAVPGSRVVLMDDVLATGGTICATLGLLQRLQCKIIEVAVLIELCDLNGRARLQDHQVFSLLQD